MRLRRGARGNYTSLLLVDWAIRENVLPSLLDSLIASLATAVSDRFGEASEQFRAHFDYLQEITDCLRGDEALSEGETHDWFRHYLREVQSVEPGLSTATESQDELEELFSHALEESCSISGLYRSHGLYQANVHDYEALIAIAAGAYPREALLLAPLYFLTLELFRPMDCWAELHPLVHSFANRSKDGCSLNNVVAILREKNIDVKTPFISAIAVADPTLLLATEPELTVCELDRTLPQIRLAARCVARADYVTMQGPYAGVDQNGQMDFWYEWPRLDAAKAKRALERVCPGADQRGIGWLQIAAKAALLSFSPAATEQGMPLELHEAIVDLMKRSARATSAAELERGLGIKLPFSPETLPPGRIMAYARHRRFLAPERAVYVLRDWAETSTEKRGRILRDRIVTPFEEKDVEFDPAVAYRVLAEDPLHSAFGLASLNEVAGKVARQLPKTPTELYYRYRIRKRLEDLLTERGYVSLGLDFVAKRDRIPERGADETLHQWRFSIVTQLLNHPADTLAAVERISDPLVRAGLFKLLRHVEPQESVVA